MKKIILLLSVIWAGTSSAGVLGDFQTFTPNTDGLYFVTVDSGMTLKKGVLVANGYLSFARNHMIAYDSLATLNRVNHKDSLTEFDTTIGYSFSDAFQFFLGITALLQQEPDSGQSQSVYISEGVHSYRPGFKWQFSAAQRSRWALMASVDLLNVENDPYTGVNPDPIPNLQLAWSGAIGNSHTHGFNLGYRMRRPKKDLVPGAFAYPLKDQLTFSYGYSHYISKPTRFIFETIGCYPLDKGQNKSIEDVSCLEFLGALRYRHSNTWAFVGGATVEAPGVQTLSPDWRVFVGANFYMPTGGGKKTESQAPPLNDGRSRDFRPPMDAAVETLRLEPDAVEIFADQKTEFVTVGGHPPYSYDIVEGGGRVDEMTGDYRAPSNPGYVRLRVTDGMLEEAFAEIRIVEVETADQKISLNDLQFEFNSTELTAASKPKLNALIRDLRQIPVRLLIVEGHTDDIGSDIYNEDLSARRSRAIANFIRQELGYTPDMVRSIGHGENKPLVPNRDDASRARNRRVEFLIYKR